MSSLDISIIIVTKNESKNIEQCITSVIESIIGYNYYEIIMVDSFSNDTTVELARKYPIKIIQLRPDWPHSASAGEYIGFKYSSGKYVLFIDGDMILDKNWFKNSLAYLERENVAGVGGIIKNVFEENNCPRLVANRANKGFDNLKNGEVDVLGGPAMFKRSILEEVGCYHPFLKAGEEAELSLRIRNKNYKLFRIPVQMVIHKDSCINLEKFLYKYQWKYVIEVGKSLRYASRTNWHIFLRKTPTLILSLLLNLLLFFDIFGIGIFIFFRNFIFCLVITMIYLSIFSLSLIKWKAIKTALLSLIVVHVRAYAMVNGFLKNIPNPTEYPTNPIFIK